MGVIFIGEFPPPYGGVTIKSKLLYDKIYKSFSSEPIDLYKLKKNPLKVFKLPLLFIASRFKKDRIIIATDSDHLVLLLRIIHIFGGKKSLSRVSAFMMGGTFHNITKSNKGKRRLIKNINAIFAESKSIVRSFKKQGIKNAFYYPNCRLSNCSLKAHDINRPIRLLFFSKICPEKGVESIFQILKQLDHVGMDYTMTFYGPIDETYKQDFLRELKKNSKCSYNGVFDSLNSDLYQELSQYDVLLFPSVWRGEGVPGILVESKFAGIPAVVSAHNFNAEVVTDNVDGFVVSKKNMIDGFTQAITCLINDPMLYNSMSINALNSKQQYNVETYVERIIKITT